MLRAPGLGLFLRNRTVRPNEVRRPGLAHRTNRSRTWPSEAPETSLHLKRSGSRSDRGWWSGAGRHPQSVPVWPNATCCGSITCVDMCCFSIKNSMNERKQAKEQHARPCEKKHTHRHDPVTLCQEGAFFFAENELLVFIR